MNLRALSSLALGSIAVLAVAQTSNPGLQTRPEIRDYAPQVVVEFNREVDVRLFASSKGLRIKRAFASGGNIWVLGADSLAAASYAAAQLAKDPLVASVFQDYYVYPTLSWEPNDPLYNHNTPVGQNGQWHLRNTENVGGANIDARVWNAWQRGLTGQGVVIGILDDGLQTTHPDLAPNLSAANSYDFVGGDANPSPDYPEEEHGTAVAGVAGARGNNGIGVTGVAPSAALAGLRLPILAGGTVSTMVDATKYRSSGSVRTIPIKNHSYGYHYPYLDRSEEVAALQASLDAGTIHVWSAMNERGSDHPLLGAVVEDTNKAALQATPKNITVAALGADGKFSSYSNYGASVAVTAPSSSGPGLPSITSTDRLTNGVGYDGIPGYPDYTNNFGGTSSSAPLVAGVLALAKEVQPALNARFAKHLLAISSDLVDPADTTVTSDGGWRTNAAGIRFNQNYGFGLINADRLTSNAVLYSGVTPLESELITTTNVNASIPNNSPNGRVRTFQIASSKPLEEMVVNLNLTHPKSGDIQAYLTSPSGYRVRIWSLNPKEARNFNQAWRVSTNAFWGENPQGTWSLEVQDRAASNAGTWNSFTVRAYVGSLIAVPRDDAEYVSETAAFGPGERKSVKIRFKNTGNTAWATGDTILKADAATAAAWGVASTPLRTNTAPGGTAEFVFYATAPSTVGTYPWVWQVTKNTVAIGQPNPNLTKVVEGYSSDFVSQTGLKRNLKPGEKFTAYLTFANNGTLPWQKSDGVCLKSQWPLLNATWGPSKVYFNTVVNPGQSFMVKVAATAPMTPGTYAFKWQLGTGGTAVFGEVNNTFNVNVVP